MRTHEEYKEMLEAYALGALAEAEASDLEAHLSTCASCRAESEELLEVAAVLSFAAPPAEPGAHVRSGILDRIRAEGAGPVPAAGAVAERDGRAVSKSPAAESNVAPFEKPAHRTWGAVAKFGALAAALAFVALAVSLALLWSRYNEARQETARLSEGLEQVRRELASERVALAHEREVRELLSAPGARVTILAGTEMAAGARAKLVVDRDTGRAMLMADALPAAPEGKAYQLWFIAEGKPPMPGHVFNTDPAGHAEMRDQLPLEARSATLFAVTLEPSGGVPAPTGPKYLLGSAS